MRKEATIKSVFLCRKKIRMKKRNFGIMGGNPIVIEQYQRSTCIKQILNGDEEAAGNFSIMGAALGKLIVFNSINIMCLPLKNG